MPSGSETEAKRFVFAAAAVSGISALLRFLTTPVVTVGVLVLALVVPRKIESQQPCRSA
jgi:hypothetical protein